MLPGLHATLVSMFESLCTKNPECFDLMIFLDGVGVDDRKLVETTCMMASPCVKVHIREYEPRAPQGANGLNGNYTTFGRIYLADLLPEHSVCIYLDSDLIIRRDIRELAQMVNQDQIVCAAGLVPREQSVDRDLYLNAGLDMTGSAFNAGVLVINLQLWRSGEIGLKIRNAAKQYSRRFKKNDQGLLNLVLADSYRIIDGKWNTFIYPESSRLREYEECVYHFVGEPKPWDLFGNKLNQNFDLWHQSYVRSSSGSTPVLRYVSVKRLCYIFIALIRALLSRSKEL